MKSRILFQLSLLLILFAANNAVAQITSTSSHLIAQPIADRTVPFDIFATGVAKPVAYGLDLAWLDGNNVRRGIAFIGKERVKIIRSSFMPTNPLVGDTALQGEALVGINKRLDIIANYMGPGTQIMLNDDNPSVHADFYQNPVNWTKLMKVTAKYHEKRGFKVVSVAPFNEPDNTGAGQGTVQDFVNINTEVRKDPYFNGKRLSGPNMLNTDVFFNWYNPMKNQVDEGNTHQLAGSFDNYALIFQTLRAEGKHATNDELHNVMEAMVGAEYGLQTGIWWGTAELARGEFCKASDGVRLGYAEHRPYWTSASVYRHPDGKVQAFGGASERQSATTSYRYISKDRDVYYDGHGPQREFVLELPGGAPNTYGTTLHCSPERVINITWGADIQPVINGRYKLVNRKSAKVMETASGNIRQNTYTGTAVQQWNVTPIDSRIGGDFSYFKIANVYDGLCPDVLGFSLENGANIIPYTLMTANQQWYLEYAEDGWFYIRSKHSNKCIEVANSSIAAGANIQQWEKNGGANQQWRFLPITAPIEFVAPGLPLNLTATNQSSSVRLDWAASPETDVAGYTIFRADSANGAYNTIARNVTTTAFVDNTTIAGKQYFYAVKAVDKSLNSSDFSSQVSTTATGNKDLLVHLKFNNTTMDTTVNLNHGAHYGAATYTEGKEGTAVALNGTSAFIQLPPTIVSTNEITITTWVYWKGINAGQRIFEFSNDQNEYIYLTPRSGSSKLCFGMKKNGIEKLLNSTFSLPLFTWSHVAVTINSKGTTLYLNGVQVANSATILTNPLDIKPMLNYIGRSQSSSNPLFNGSIDDFRVYNYALTGAEVTQLAGILSDDNSGIKIGNELKVWPSPANDIVHVEYAGNNLGKATLITVYKPDGKIVFSQTTQKSNIELNTSHLSSGLYFLKIINENQSQVKNFVVKH